MTEREDQDLRSYLDNRFDQIDKRFDQVDERFDHVDDRFEQVNRRFEGVDEQLEGMATREEMDERFGQMDGRLGQMDHRFETIEERLDSMPTREEMQAGLAENRRHFSVIAESLEANIQLLAEGHGTLLEGQDRIRLENKETAAEIRAEQSLAHAFTNRRIGSLERQVSDMDTRVERIEEKARG